MYWLLGYEEQERIRQVVINIQKSLSADIGTNQLEQQFPFLGRKDREISKVIIGGLTERGEIVCDPFSGSGTFAYASLDMERKTIMNEWEPYAFRMSTAPFRKIPSLEELEEGMLQFKKRVEPIVYEIYKTKCPTCGNEMMFDGLFYDRRPEEYYNPTVHERMGRNNENIIFRGKYKCICGQKDKHFDDFDKTVLDKLDDIKVAFLESELIENSRLNFTHPEFEEYKNLFSKRQQIALMSLYNEIEKMDDIYRDFFYDTFISIIHLGKYVDYRSKSQDNHCPENRIKETNLYHRFLETVSTRYNYIVNQHFNLENLTVTCKDFREALSAIPKNSVNLVLTDPPYGDNAQYFEHAQRVHPFMKYNLINDSERLAKEVVISNAPERQDKHGKEQFFNDIEKLFIESSRILKEHGFFTLYFRPRQSDWISDLNRLKHFGRKHGLEPLMTIPISKNDPSMRVLASAAWAFSKDICFIFLKLAPGERRWYEGDNDIDELIYLAARNASNDKGEPFMIERFNTELRKKLMSERLVHLSSNTYAERIKDTLARYCVRDYARYILTGNSPYNFINQDMNAEMRLREFAPIVIEELTYDNRGFTFEEYIIHLASYMDNGSKKIIEKLHTSNRLIPELLLEYAYEDKDRGKFYIRPNSVENNPEGRIRLYDMDPHDFEVLVADYFLKRGFVKTQVIGRSCDRGVDILATDSEGELELIQCKRYRKKNKIGSAPIQRIDSYMRSRNAKKSWVVTTSDFTKEGIDEARITGVILLNGENLLKSLEVYYPGKYIL